jgi:hypothetical protein
MVKLGWLKAVNIYQMMRRIDSRTERRFAARTVGER